MSSSSPRTALSSFSPETRSRGVEPPPAPQFDRGTELGPTLEADLDLGW